MPPPELDLGSGTDDFVENAKKPASQPEPLIPARETNGVENSSQIARMTRYRSFRYKRGLTTTLSKNTTENDLDEENVPNFGKGYDNEHQSKDSSEINCDDERNELNTKGWEFSFIESNADNEEAYRERINLVDRLGDISAERIRRNRSKKRNNHNSSRKKRIPVTDFLKVLRKKTFTKKLQDEDLERGSRRFENLLKLEHSDKKFRSFKFDSKTQSILFFEELRCEKQKFDEEIQKRQHKKSIIAAKKNKIKTFAVASVICSVGFVGAIALYFTFDLNLV